MAKTYLSASGGRKFLSAAAVVAALILAAVLRAVIKHYAPGFELPSGVRTALIILYAVFALILLPLWHRSLKYVINDKEIISCSGILARSYRITRLSAVQHAQRISLPLSKLTGFNFISVNALGGRAFMMFLSEKDCREIMGMLDGMFKGRIRTEPAQPVYEKHEAFRGKYSVSSAQNGDSDYVYTDNSAILSSREVNDIAEDYSGYTQLTFGEQSSSQLSFGDIENDNDRQGGV